MLDTDFLEQTALPKPQAQTLPDDQLKSAINELKKKGQPYLETSRDLKKIYIEDLKISEIKMQFSFQSSPIMFREFTMNPTLKFLLVLFSNLKNLNIKLKQLHG